MNRELSQEPKLRRNDSVTVNVVLFLVLSACWLVTARNAGSQEVRDHPVSESSSVLTPLRVAARMVKAGELGVGRRIPDFSFQDIQGNSGKLSDFSEAEAIVIAMTGTGCPLCKKYAPSLVQLEQHYASRGVAFLFVNPNASERLERLKEEVASKGFQGPYVRDEQKEIARRLQVKTTTEVFVLDRARTLVYRGAVDDQYGLGYALGSPRRTYLVDALDAVLDQQTPDVRATTAPGCEMFYSTEISASGQPELTYHNRISRIIQQNCLECHHPSGVAPLELETYDQVRDHAAMIRQVVQQERMPPWFAAAAPESGGEEPQHSVWSNDRSLSQAEKDDLLNWIDAGLTAGDPAQSPLPRLFSEEWLIGRPDAVFKFPEPIQVKATGILPYKNIVVETNLEEDQWVQAIEVIPGDRSVVHHVLVLLLPPNQGDSRNARGGGVDYWARYVPGNSTQVYPDGFARKLPKGSRLRFQMHYTTNGTETEDRTKIGLIYADTPPRFEVRTASIVNTRFRIPPGAANHRVDASIQVPVDTVLLGLLPHHHLRGKASRYQLTTPSGESELLLDVPRYDFNWQLFYQYAEPKAVAQGSRIDFTAWYDNSEGNPANPNSAKTVGWGEQTFDEMHLGYIEYIVPSEQLSNENDLSLREREPTSILLRRLDANGDGVITPQEVRAGIPDSVDAALRIFDRLDQDHNGKLEQSELDKAGIGLLGRIRGR